MLFDSSRTKRPRQFSLFTFPAICCLLIFCCSCQKKPKRIIFSLPCPKSTTSNEKPTSQSTRKFICGETVKPSCRLDKDDEFEYKVLEREAKVGDIPIAPKTSPLPDYFKAEEKSAGMVLGYSYASDSASIISFYEQQMASFGWRILGKIESSETILLFEKPDRICIISLRKCHKNAHALHQLVITIVNKKKSSGD